jgi:uncharacterized protein (DUF58 family)
MPDKKDKIRLPSRFSDFQWGLQREGLLLYVLMFAIGLAAYNTGNNLLFLFVSVMATVIVTHSCLNYFSRQNHEIERRLPSTLVAGEIFTVTLRLHNKKRFFSSHAILLQEDKPELRQFGRVFFGNVRPGQTAIRHYDALLPGRGRYQFGPLWLRSRFPFGLSLQSMRYVIPEEVIVYPAIHSVRPELLAAGSMQGYIERPDKGFGFSLYGLREYQAGESSRLIHWKTSAKMDRLMVKEFEDEQLKRATVLFENLFTGDSRRDRDDFEKKVSDAASYVAHLIRQGWQVELVTLSAHFPFGQGAQHLDRMLRHLALIEPAALSKEQARQRLAPAVRSDGGFSIQVSTQTEESKVRTNPLSAPPWVVQAPEEPVSMEKKP